MSYQTCRDHLAEILATVENVKRVYADPPANLADVPAIIFYGSGGSIEYSAGGMVTPDEEHTETLRLFLTDAQYGVAVERVRDIRTAMFNSLRDEGGLGSDGTITMISFDPPSDMSYNDKPYTGMTFRVKFLVYDP